MPSGVTAVRILVTGASGLLGTNLALEASRQHTVFGVTNKVRLTTSVFTSLQADLLAPGSCQRLLNEIQPDWVINCAALADIDACERHPEQAEQLNSVVPAKLADYVARGGARLLHVSTDAVFDGKKGNYTELDPPNPLSVYAATKLKGEQAVLDANPQTLVARINLIGWSSGGKRSLAEYFFYNLRSGNLVNGFTDVFFCPLHANEVARIFLKLLALETKGLFHVVSSECLTKYDFSQRIAQKFKLDGNLVTPISVTKSGLAAERSTRLTLNTVKLEKTLGYPPPDTDSAINEFYDQFRKGYPQKLKTMVEQPIENV